MINQYKGVEYELTPYTGYLIAGKYFKTGKELKRFINKVVLRIKKLERLNYEKI